MASGEHTALDNGHHELLPSLHVLDALIKEPLLVFQLLHMLNPRQPVADATKCQLLNCFKRTRRT